MGELNEIEQEKLRKLADEILRGGKPMVEEFDYDSYSKEQLIFLLRAIDAINAQELNRFMQTLDQPGNKKKQ